MKSKLTSGSFWVSMVSAVILILKAIFGWEIDNTLVANISNSALGILVVFGIVQDHNKQNADDKTDEDK